MASWLQAI